MKTNTAERKEHVEMPWNYEDETRKIYTGVDMADIVRDAERRAEMATITDFVRTFLELNVDASAAIDVFAAAASFKYNIVPKKS